MISPKQKKILAFPYSKYDAIICDGAVRSGKTSIMTVAFIDWAMREFSGQRFGLCGKTVDSCSKNLVVPYLSMAYSKQKYILRWRRSDKILEVRRGAVTNYFEVFGGKDESSFALIQGRTLAGVLLDEVALMPRSFVEQALTRCSVDGAKLWFSCNPESPQHWFYLEWIKRHKERNVLYLHFEMTDNPGLSQKTLERYQSMFAGVFYDRYIRGLWVVAEGLIYPMFSMERNVARGESGGHGMYYISIDYGTKNPTAMGLWRVYKGEAVMEKEYYYDGRARRRQKTDEEYYQDLEQFSKEYNIERVIVDPSAASFKECIFRHGKFPVWDADNSVIDGIRLTGSLLQTGRLKFHESCTNAFREFGLYMWDDKASEDKPLKENDHVMDMIRYFAATVMRRE
ncbi:PBSX family phage terminase large subunit [Anaerotruncus colihominis]|nr:PBSX family phage terminase large subunit [Anaerotruncus colihominis]UOX65507.1 PBSX family phage terminase large subunit [Anaerotruncus colihominis]DAV34128.1 MAG TPA: large terminase [Caudoviricetes sp.]